MGPGELKLSVLIPVYNERSTIALIVEQVNAVPVPKEVMAKTSVVDKSNYQAYETPAERRPCPTLESMAAK